MKKTKIFYWTFNALFCFIMLGSAIPDIASSPVAIEGMHGQLGYPIYFIPFIGVAKALGVLAVLLPVSARIKEWAYAGLSFDLIGATFSIFASGQAANAWFMILPISLAVLAYYFFRRKQALSSISNNVLTTSIDKSFQAPKLSAALS